MDRAILPPELCDMIIDHLHSDRPALKACSLVCKAWLPSSLYHLLSAIHLDLSLPSTALQPFFQRLSQRDVLLYTSIRAVSLRHAHNNARPYFAALASLRNLSRLSLTHWSLTLPNLTTLADKGALRNVTNLHLSTGAIDFLCFTSLACHLPALETLALANFAWTEGNSAARATAGQIQDLGLLPRLRALHLDNSSAEAAPAFAAMFARGTISGKVEQLRVDQLVCGVPERAVAQLLRVIGRSLRSLVISARTTLSINNTLALRQNRNLVEIRFEDLVDPQYVDEVRGSLSSEWVFSMLAHAPVSVEVVGFSFWLLPGDTLGLNGEPGGAGLWSRFERVLRGLTGLKRIMFFFGAKTQHRQWLGRRISYEFRALRGLLSFEALEPSS